MESLGRCVRSIRRVGVVDGRIVLEGSGRRDVGGGRSDGGTDAMGGDRLGEAAARIRGSGGIRSREIRSERHLIRGGILANEYPLASFSVGGLSLLEGHFFPPFAFSVVIGYRRRSGGGGGMGRAGEDLEELGDGRGSRLGGSFGCGRRRGSGIDRWSSRLGRGGGRSGYEDCELDRWTVNRRVSVVVGRSV